MAKRGYLKIISYCLIGILITIPVVFGLISHWKLMKLHVKYKKVVEKYANSEITLAKTTADYNKIRRDLRMPIHVEEKDGERRLRTAKLGFNTFYYLGHSPFESYKEEVMDNNLRGDYFKRFSDFALKKLDGQMNLKRELIKLSKKTIEKYEKEIKEICIIKDKIMNHYYKSKKE